MQQVESPNNEVKKMLENAGSRPKPPFFRLRIMGGIGSGKSSLIRNMLDEKFTERALYPIPDPPLKTIVIDGKAMKVIMWEEITERFLPGRQISNRGIHGFIIVYDVTDLESFQAVHQRLNEIHERDDNNAITVLVGNKCDLSTLRVIDFDAAKQYADEHNISFFETSAKTSANVMEVLTMLVTEMYHKISQNDDLPQTEEASSPNKKQKCEIQ